MYSAVLFDLFGTLIPSPSMTDYRQMVAKVAETLGNDFERFFPLWMSVNDRRLDGSFGSSEGDITAVAELVGATVSDAQLAECMRIRRDVTRRFLQPRPGVIDLLQTLERSSISVGLVTDCVYDVPAIWPESEMSRYVQSTHFSCETGVRKPDRQAYESALSQLGINDPSRVLFVGDGGSDELNGAVRCGMDALMITAARADGEVLRVGVTGWDGPVALDFDQVAKTVLG